MIIGKYFIIKHWIRKESLVMNKQALSDALVYSIFFVDIILLDVGIFSSYMSHAISTQLITLINLVNILFFFLGRHKHISLEREHHKDLK